jgi:hypothetical protein
MTRALGRWQTAPFGHGSVSAHFVFPSRDQREQFA